MRLSLPPSTRSPVAPIDDFPFMEETPEVDAMTCCLKPQGAIFGTDE